MQKGKTAKNAYNAMKVKDEEIARNAKKAEKKTDAKVA